MLTFIGGKPIKADLYLWCGFCHSKCRRGRSTARYSKVWNSVCLWNFRVRVCSDDLHGKSFCRLFAQQPFRRQSSVPSDFFRVWNVPKHAKNCSWAASHVCKQSRSMFKKFTTEWEWNKDDLLSKVAKYLSRGFRLHPPLGAVALLISYFQVW